MPGNSSENGNATVNGDYLPSSALWKKLREYLGVSEYEAKVYVSLVNAGISKASTLSIKAGIPRTKVYNVLERLGDMGLIVEVPGKTKEFTTTSPKAVFESYLRSYQSITKNLLSIISSLEETFEKAKKEEKLREGTIWIMGGRDETLKKMREMLSTVKISVDLVTNENGIIPLYKSFNWLFDELAKRSVKVRIMAPLNSSNQHITSELKYTCRITEINFHLPLIFLSIDKRQFLLAYLRPADSSSYLEPCKSIFSDNILLHDTMNSLILGRVAFLANST